MTQYLERAVVLRTYKLGEADRIVVLMTQSHGKVRAVAKGIRKTKSKIGGTANQRDTLRSLGLKRIGDTVIKDDRPEFRGMVNMVSHLVVVEEVD